MSQRKKRYKAGSRFGGATRFKRWYEEHENSSKAESFIHKKEEEVRLLRRNIQKYSPDPHDVEIRHYFDISSGLRATDKAHKAAVDCFERITPKLSTRKGSKEVAEEALIMAEHAREMVAALIGCEPKNVFFGNSATRTLLPIFLSLAKQGSKNLVVMMDDYRAIGGLLKADPETFQSTITRQNFGEAKGNEHLRNFDDASAMKKWIHDHRLFLCYLEFKKNYSLPWLKKADVGGIWPSQQPSIFYCSHINRERGHTHIHSIHEALKVLKKKHPSSLMIVDASHSAGVAMLDAPSLGDVVILNSSKALGGEPTLGICYVGDDILKVLEENLKNTKWPRIAFQFSPETALGIRSTEEVVDCKYWISLPEIYSLHTAIQESDMGRRKQRLAQLRTYFDGMIQFFDAYDFLRIETMQGASNFIPILITIVPEKLPAKGRLAKYVDIIGQINDEDLRKRAYASILEEQIRPLAQKIEPFVITSEFPGDKRFNQYLEGGYLHTITPFLRISWSEEHTIEDAKGLCRKIAKILDDAFDANFLQHIDEVEQHLFSGHGEDGAKAMRFVDSPEILKTVAFAHKDDKVRAAAMEKITEHSDFKRIALECHFDDTACSALDKLGIDREALLEIAEGGRSLAACGLAIKKLLLDPELSYEKDKAKDLLRMHQPGFSYDSDWVFDNEKLDLLITNYLEKRHTTIYDAFSIKPIRNEM